MIRAKYALSKQGLNQEAEYAFFSGSAECGRACWKAFPWPRPLPAHDDNEMGNLLFYTIIMGWGSTSLVL